MNTNDRNLGYYLSKASRLTKWVLNSRLAELGLTASQWSVLKDIYVNERLQGDQQDFTPASIAQRLHSDRPTISGIVERLVKQGWLLREENPNDRRSQLIRLTEKAWELMPRLEEEGYGVMELAVVDFNEEELRELKKYLNRIINNLSNIGQ